MNLTAGDVFCVAVTNLPSAEKESNHKNWQSNWKVFHVVKSNRCKVIEKGSYYLDNN